MAAESLAGLMVEAGPIAAGNPAHHKKRPGLDLEPTVTAPDGGAVSGHAGDSIDQFLVERTRPDPLQSPIRSTPLLLDCPASLMAPQRLGYASVATLASMHEGRRSDQTELVAVLTISFATTMSAWAVSTCCFSRK